MRQHEEQGWIPLLIHTPPERAEPRAVPRVQRNLHPVSTGVSAIVTPAYYYGVLRRYRVSCLPCLKKGEEVHEIMDDENLFIKVDFDKGDFPKRYTCDGEDLSPRIDIDRIHSPFLAVIIDDWIGPDERFTHWLIWDIEARPFIPENIPRNAVLADPFPAFQGTNDFGTIGYRGPCPPPGQTHTYYFNVYGLDAKLGIAAGSGRAALDKAMKGHMVQYGGQAIATYNR